LLTSESNNELTFRGKSVTIEIDPLSGFCFGVARVVQLAEDHLKTGQSFYSLGDMVHNHREMDRLKALGLKTVDLNEFSALKTANVLFRAHGEPPSSYTISVKNKLNLTDGTCPVVKKLQERIKNAWETQTKENGQVVIFGKKGHAEVIGLMGQTNNEALVIETLEDMKDLDFNRPMEVFSQTTSSMDAYNYLCQLIQEKAKAPIKIHDTICRQVSNREPWLKKFAKNYDVVIFVGGKKSSNGQYLYQVCKNENPNTYIISDSSELNFDWFTNQKQIGISGATSTPTWLMKEVAQTIHQHLN
jgi:4-hydroxy-3-methylbut-2-enyl diphosphate reductase